MFTPLLARLLACLLTTAALTAHAVPPPAGLTLAAAQARVMQRSPELAALAHDAAAQDGLVRQAGAVPNPELSGLLEDRDSATRTTTIQLTQAIELGGKRGARIDAAQAERELAAAALNEKRAQLRARTSSAFYQLLAAQARLELADAALALAAQALDGASTRVAAGKNSPLDAARARIALSGAEIERAQAGADAATARETLAALWGGAGHDLERIEGQLARLPDAAPLAHLLARLPDAPALARARLELQRRLALGRLEKSRRAPDLAVTVGSKKDAQFGHRQAVFGLAMPLPLFDRNQGRVDESAQRSEQARAELAAVSAALASELRIAHGRLLAARSQAHTLQTAQLPDAVSTDEAARKAYAYGKFGMLDVIDAQRVLLQAKTLQLRVLADAHAAAADIERILGAPATTTQQEAP